MLKRVDPVPAVVVCNTCRLSPDAREDEQGRRGGALLADALREVQAGNERYAGVVIQETPCLFACRDYCTIHLRAPGKISYVLGRFGVDRDAADAILDYAAHYAESEFGQVPFKNWPEGVKGHFITRSPPEGFVSE